MKHAIILLIVIFFTPVLLFAKPTANDYLVTAVYLNDFEAVKMHLNNPLTVKTELDPECPQNTRCKPVTFAANNGNIQIMELLLTAGADIDGETGSAGDTPLMIAIMKNHREMVKFLIKKGASINKVNKFGANAFWGVCGIGDVQFVELLIEHGANINHLGRYPDPLGKKQQIVQNITPIMISAKNGFDKIVKILLDNKADLKQQDSLGRTVMDYAKFSGNEDIIELLNQRL